MDLGCGSKLYEGLLSSASSYNGVDVETSGHSHADNKIDVFYDGRVLPFDDCSFDHVVSFETFEHIFNLGEVLTEIWRVVRPGRSLVISLPFGWDEHEAPFDIARYNTFGITAIMERHFFKVGKVIRSNGFVEAVFQLVILRILPYEQPLSDSKLVVAAIGNFSDKLGVADRYQAAAHERTVLLRYGDNSEEANWRFRSQNSGRRRIVPATV